MTRWLWVLAALLVAATAFVLVGCQADGIIVLKCEPLEEGGTVTEADVAKAVEILEQRAGEYGLADEGPEAGTIWLAYDGEDDQARERELQFLLGVGELEMALISEHYAAQPGAAWEVTWEDTRTGDEVAWETVYAESEVLFTRDDLEPNAEVMAGPREEWQIHFEMTDERKADCRAQTGANVGRHVAVVLDGHVLMAPVIRSAISGVGVIDGDFTERQAKIVSRVLNTEPLPVALRVIEEAVEAEEEQAAIL
jgi:preprotein translocase subunit SecD